MKFSCLFLLCATAFAFSGCQKPVVANPVDSKVLKLAVVANNVGPFWILVRQGSEQAAQEAGDVELDFRVTFSGKAQEQRQIIEDLINKGVQGIAISPIDPVNQTDLLNKAASKALLITADSDAPQSNRVAYIGTDNRAAGHQAGKLLKEALPKGGEVVVFVPSLDTQNARERYEGLKEEIAGSKIQVLEVFTDATSRARAKTNVIEALEKYPKVAALVGLVSSSGPAILDEVRRAGKSEEIKIVAFDEEEETIAGVASGEIYGTVVQQPYEIGRQAVLAMAKYLRGDKQSLSNATTKPVQPVTKKQADVPAPAREEE